MTTNEERLERAAKLADGAGEALSGGFARPEWAQASALAALALLKLVEMSTPPQRVMYAGTP